MAGAPHLTEFLDAARSFIGLEENPPGSNEFTDPKGYEMLSLAGFGGGGSWCAIFVMACAKKAGILGTVIGRDPWATAPGVLLVTADECGGTFIEGPIVNGGVAVTPIPGDLITFGDEYYNGYEHARHIGIVEKVVDGVITTIEGNIGNKCDRNTYALDSDSINMYVRPDWASVGDDLSAYGVDSFAIGPLYNSRNDRHDMTLREVGYLDDTSYALTNKKTGVAISIINYTTVFSDIYDLLGPNSVAIETIRTDTSQLFGNIKLAMDFFLENGFSPAGSAGIVACLQFYSKIDTYYSEQLPDGKYGMGICVWHDNKLGTMQTRVGADWRRNLTGQLTFLLDDLSANYQGLAQATRFISNTVAEAQTTAQTFIAVYDSRYNTISNKNTVMSYAKHIYDKLLFIKESSAGNPITIKDINGKLMNSSYCISIPNYVDQTGIIDDFTSYSHFYHIWGSGTVQRELADIWYYQGCPCDKGVATIDGYYLVAVRPKFGKVGDIIVVELENNDSFSAIIADEKGSDAGSEWGHIKGNGISIIEWERIVTYNGEVQTDKPGASIVDALGFNDWLGQDVVRITNYGSFL